MSVVKCWKRDPRQVKGFPPLEIILNRQGSEQAALNWTCSDCEFGVDLCCSLVYVILWVYDFINQYLGDCCIGGAMTIDEMRNGEVKRK